MSSAFSGVRMVARALPGRGGSAARARASAACFAAWRAAQGAAPRRPSLRFSAPLSSEGFGGGPFPVGAAPGFLPVAAPLGEGPFCFAAFLLAALVCAGLEL